MASPLFTEALLGSHHFPGVLGQHHREVGVLEPAVGAAGKIAKAPRDGQHFLKLRLCGHHEVQLLSLRPRSWPGLGPKNLAPRGSFSASIPNPDLDLVLASCGRCSESSFASGSASFSGLGTSEVATQQPASSFINLQKERTQHWGQSTLFPHLASSIQIVPTAPCYTNTASPPLSTQTFPGIEGLQFPPHTSSKKS